MEYIETKKLTCCNDQMIYIKEYQAAACVWCSSIEEDIRDIEE